jgi:hypothetical protein
MTGLRTLGAGFRPPLPVCCLLYSVFLVPYLFTATLQPACGSMLPQEQDTADDRAHAPDPVSELGRLTAS